MRIRTIALASGVALAVTAAVSTPANAAENFGEVTEGTTVTMTYTGCDGGGSFSLKLDGNEVDSAGVDEDPGLFDQFNIDTTGLAPGDYVGSITCAGQQDPSFNAVFTVVPSDPCAPVETTPVPEGPGRAPHGAPVDCADSGIPDTGSDSSTVLLIGGTAIVVGTGLLIARRRTLA